MATILPGETTTLTAEWRMYAGGPLVAVTGVQITITEVVTAAVVVGPTSSGVNTPAVGMNAYAWTPSGLLAAGSYLIAWTGTDSDGDTVTATELVDLARSDTEYTDLQTVRASLGMTAADVTADTLIASAIRSASRHIDARTGRRFYAEATATARTFPASRVLYDGGAYVLVVDDIATSTGLLMGGVALSGVTTGPDNATAYGRPITYLRGTDGGSSPFLDSTTVTAQWGWPAVPDEVEQAATLLAARLYRRKDSPEGVIGSDQWGVTRVARVDPDVEALISHLRLPGFA